MFPPATRSGWARTRPSRERDAEFVTLSGELGAVLSARRWRRAPRASISRHHLLVDGREEFVVGVGEAYADMASQALAETVVLPRLRAIAGV